jgi:6-phosphogluconolactonase (cycloisomerase 2 family)
MSYPKSIQGRTVNRRGFLAAVFTGPLSMSADAQTGNRTARSILAYVGTSKPHGEGIYLMRLDTATGRLTRLKVFSFDRNPTWLALNPRQTRLYSADEVSNFKGTTAGSVSAWSIDRATGDLTLLNSVSSRGAGPAHLSVHPSGRYVFIANYAGGSVAVFPVREDGSLADAADVKQDVDAVGPINAAGGPSGSFAISGHDAPHGHMIESDRSGRFVYWADLGQDRLYFSAFNEASGALAAPTYVSTSPGAGPRHFAFHAKRDALYLLNEEASTVSFYSVDPGAGALRLQQTLSTLPQGFAGTNFTSEIRISSDGRFVYCANRLHDSIAIFSVGQNGKLALVGEEWTRGDYPRSFTIDPTGKWLFVCNQRTDHITGFRIKGGGGQLEFTGEYASVGSPAIIIFVA